MNKPANKSAGNGDARPGQTQPQQTESRPESIGEFVRKHPGAFIAGGVLLGVAAGALLPRGAGRWFVKGAVAMAATVAETSLQLGRHARDTAEDITREGRGTIERNAAVAQRKAAELAGSARTAGSKLVDQAVELASRVRH